MNDSQNFRDPAVACGIFASALTIQPASAASLSTLSSFNGANGAYPWAGVIADANGNLFGTTTTEGLGPGLGTVFEIVKTASGYDSTPTTLVSFDNANGAVPLAGLIADANGNLFSTTNQGGANNQGTVFKIVSTVKVTSEPV